MNANSSLSFITENSADWIRRLDDLTGQIASRQAELSELDARPLRQKHGSTESLRPRDDGEGENGAGMEQQTSPVSPGAARQYQAQQLRRKRKTSASITTNGSGTSKYRTRSMIIVYYDSAVQEAFEGIVRNIGTARNNIRRGKMATAMQRMAVRVEDNNTDPQRKDNLRSQLTYTRTSRSRGGEEKSVHDQIDAGLDFSQGQCERAAHQFLRDGDCTEEILSIRNKMEEITVLAAKELERVEAEEAEKKKKKEQQLAAAKEQGKDIDDDDDDEDSEPEIQLPQLKNFRRPPHKAFERHAPNDEPIEVDPDL